MTAAEWLEAAERLGWGGLEGLSDELREWRGRHHYAPSPHLICRTCGDVVLDPALARTAYFRDLRCTSDESFAERPCRQCKGKEKVYAE